jgi:hypothetical protein
MSVSISVEAYRDKNLNPYKKHAAVLRACIDAGIKYLPKETAEYFSCNEPSEHLFDEKLSADLKVQEFEDDYKWGFVLDVRDIPEDVTTILFCKYS